MGRYPLIGKLAIKNKLLLKEDLDKALSVFSDDVKNLEEELIKYLISTKLISSRNIEKLQSEAKALDARDNKLKFGAIAVKKSFISKTNLDFIIEEQESDIIAGRKAKLIGEMFIEAGLITSKQRDLVLQEQKKFEKDAQGTADKDGSLNSKESLLLEPVKAPYGLKLQLSGDFSAAFLIKTEKFEPSCSVDDIKDILIDNDIIFGVVTDEMIISFLKSDVFQEKPFRIARGIKPVHGEDAKIVYYFNTEHLQAGGVSKDGQIDFKDRGKIPQVEQGMVLAEKTEMVEPLDGKNIYGETMVAKPAVDIELKTGKGVNLSANGLQVLASTKGNPVISPGGEICVQEEYVITGDVDFETGHIVYEGNINIKGCIKSGFRVEGEDIKAHEIDDGIIDAEGDVTISGGVNSGKVSTRGNFSAKFVHKSHIICMGDVSVNSEILDTLVETRGKCLVLTGRIMSSEIISKLGVFTKDIGTEKGKPSNIKVGHDIFTEKELMENKISIDDLNKFLGKMVEEQETKKEENTKLQQEIFDYGQLQDTSQTLQRKILSKLDSLKSNDKEIETPKPLKEKLDQLQADISLAEKKLEIYFEASNELEKQIQELGKKIGKQKLKIKNLEFERESLIKWVEKNPGKPIVTASGVIMAKTIIQGESSKRVLEEEVKNAQVKEIRDTKPGAGPDAYIMDIIN